MAFPKAATTRPPLADPGLALDGQVFLNASVLTAADGRVGLSRSVDGVKPYRRPTDADRQVRTSVGLRGTTSA